MEILQKPAGRLCSHASEGGCAIYAARPVVCRDYTCLWLDGEFEDAQRPDRFGLAFDRPDILVEHLDYVGVLFICARELWPGARKGRSAAALLLRLSRGMVVRLQAYGGKTQLIGPPSSIDLLVARASARRAARQRTPSPPTPRS